MWNVIQFLVVFFLFMMVTDGKLAITTKHFAWEFDSVVVMDKIVTFINGKRGNK